MQLIYNEDCDPNYEPPGFKPREDTRTWYAEYEGWVMKSMESGGVDTLYHALAMKISFLEPITSVDAGVSICDGELGIPESLHYIVETSLDYDIDHNLKAKAAEARRLCTVSDHRQNDQLDLENAQRIPHTGQLNLEEGSEIHPSAYTQGSTQAREDRRQLQGMLNMSPAPQTLEETQLVEPVSARYKALMFVKNMPKIRVSERKLKELNRRKKRQNRKGTEQDTEIIDCHCGSNNEVDNATFHCKFCNCWQHLACYGYLGLEDPRIPETHACYNCLLALDKDQSLLRELDELALFRKGMICVMEQGFSKDSELSKQLGCDLKTAAQIAIGFKEKQFLVPTPGASSAVFTRSGRPKFSVVVDDCKHAEMMNTFFDPTLKIAQHVNPRA
jgi:meiosis-specific protein HOP1